MTNHMDKFHLEHPSEVKHLDTEECYYALVDESYTTHDGYSEREGGGYSTTNYIDMVRLGNREQATAWLLAKEEKQLFHTPRPFKIVLIKPVNVQRTVTITL